MEFGVQFFPSVGPETTPAHQYFDEALRLTEQAEALGFTNVRTVEHYFHHYGGLLPEPADLPRCGRGAHHDDAADHRRGAPRLQPPAEARG